MKNILKKNENGFALPLALLLLVVMSLMGSILISKVTSEHKANTLKDAKELAKFCKVSPCKINLIHIFAKHFRLKRFRKTNPTETFPQINFD